MHLKKKNARQTNVFPSNVESTVTIKAELNPLTANYNNFRLLCHLLLILKVIFANSVDPDQTAPLGASDQDQHHLPVCKNRFKKLQEYSADEIDDIFRCRFSWHFKGLGR